MSIPKIVVFLALLALSFSCSDSKKELETSEANKPEARLNTENKDDKLADNTKRKVVRTYTRSNKSSSARSSGPNAMQIPVQIKIWVGDSVLITEDDEEIKLKRGDVLTALKRQQDVLTARNSVGIIGKLDFCDSNYGLLVASGDRGTKALTLPDRRAVKSQFFRCWNRLRKDKNRGLVLQGPVELTTSPAGKVNGIKVLSWQVMKIVAAKIFENELYYQVDAGNGENGWLLAHHILGGEGGWNVVPSAGGHILLENVIKNDTQKFKEVADLWLVSGDFTRLIPKVISEVVKGEKSLAEIYIYGQPLDGMNWNPPVTMYLYKKKDVLKHLSGSWKPAVYKAVSKKMDKKTLPACEMLPANLTVDKKGLAEFSFGKASKKIDLNDMKLNNDGTVTVLQDGKELGKIRWIERNRDEVSFEWLTQATLNGLENQVLKWAKLPERDAQKAERRAKELLGCKAEANK